MKVAVDETEDRRAAEAVADGYLYRESHFGLSKAGAAAEREHGAKANTDLLSPIGFSAAELGPAALAAKPKWLGFSAPEQLRPGWFSSLRK